MKERLKNVDDDDDGDRAKDFFFSRSLVVGKVTVYSIERERKRER